MFSNLLNAPKIATCEEWGNWEANARKNKPILFFLINTIPSLFSIHIMPPLSNIKYHFLYRFVPSYRKYWCIKADTLSIGYHDATDLILHTNMQILCNFYEYQISGKGHVYWESDEEHQKLFDEVKAIYTEWKSYLTAKSNLYIVPDNVDVPLKWVFPNRGDYPEYTAWLGYCSKLELELDAKEQDLLYRLITIRQSLWD